MSLITHPSHVIGVAITQSTSRAWYAGYDDAIAGIQSPGQGISGEQWAYSEGYKAALIDLQIERAAFGEQPASNFSPALS